MKPHHLLGIVLSISLLAPAIAHADLKYFPDPAYKRLNDEDPPPMDEMIGLAKEGDTRAMFILGDMSEKGKGGLMQDRKQARTWFEESAMHGYSQSFIRLAAMAKHDKNPQEAWQWYSLAIKGFDSGDEQDYAIRARKELTESAQLTKEDTDKARKSADAWEEARDKHLREEKDGTAEKERQQKEQAEKDAKAGVVVDSNAPAPAAVAGKQTVNKPEVAKPEAAKEEADKPATEKPDADKKDTEKKPDQKPDQQENDDE